MLNLKSSLLLFALIGICAFPSSAQKLCGISELYERGMLDINQRILPKAGSNKGLKSDQIYTIPTVIHVIFKNDTENISLAQIQSQLDVLNQDFRKLNADTTNLAPGFSKADSKIVFCLADRDPDGNKTDGINRIMTSIDNVCDLNSNQYFQLAPAWDSDKYLNIWVCDINDDIAGFATFPGTASPQREGVVIDFSSFGTLGSAVFPYNKGRTTTHEIGHYFNLDHPWGKGDNNSNCTQDDGVADTPLQDGPAFGCPQDRSSCNSKDMLSNFMGFLNDACMGNFTEGQKDRMRNTLSGIRKSLIESNGCLFVGIEELKILEEIKLYPNPSKQFLKIDLPPSLQREKLQWQWFQANGQKLSIKTKTDFNGLTFNLKGYSAGIYFLQLLYEDEKITKKIMLQP